MTRCMALFGLVWLLRVRGSLCGCSACKRARTGLPESDCSDSPRTPSPEDRATFDVIALQHYTRDVTVQTDFDDEVEDLDKIEMQITEESNASNYDGREVHSRERRHGSGLISTDSDEVWESTEVTLERGMTGLGLSIAGGENGGDVSITRIAPGGAANNDGRLQIGDILTQVNDVSVEGAPHSAAVNVLQKAGNLVKLRVRRARRPRVVTLCRGARGLGLGIAGGADDATAGGVFISHIAVGGAAHHDGRLKLGDKILAVRDEHGIERSLIGATHAEAVLALRSTGDHVTLVVLPAASIPPITRTAPLHSTRTQATSCSTLHELFEEEASQIPRCVRMVRLVRTGSRLGMDIVGGLGDSEGSSEDNACGVFVSGVAIDGAACGMLHRGDRILSVDGRDLTKATHEQAAAALKYSGNAVTIAAQYQPEQYEKLRARIRAINAAALSPHTPTRFPAHELPQHPDVQTCYSRDNITR
ncbi:disks large homolog 4-like [Leptidea sinapis]|uniref:disks large homolog 4-like n=1 Tax=Leptidea sinapis TaxID=189913 RepID=UPI0021223F1B|nr:disks large homolog 4-like [Leptidea sinapis]